MHDHEFDRALVAAAFRLAGERGWSGVTVAEAARRADLKLDRARARFPVRGVILLRFGSIADQTALAQATDQGSQRDRLFDLIMRRMDVLQAHREGVRALFRALPTNPCLAALLGAANLRSMRWMLDGAGIELTGLRGRLRVKGLLAVWLATVRAWRMDTSEDLSATMSALDKALSRAEQIDGWLTGRRSAPPEPPPEPPPATTVPDAEPLPE